MQIEIILITKNIQRTLEYEHQLFNENNSCHLTLSVIYLTMIKTFKSKETEKVFHRQYSKKLPQDIQEIAFRKLRMLNRAQTLEDLKVPPGNRLERLKGDRAGQHSIRINDQWRICFVWEDSFKYDVEIVDYH